MERELGKGVVARVQETNSEGNADKSAVQAAVITFVAKAESLTAVRQRLLLGKLYIT